MLRQKRVERTQEISPTAAAHHTQERAHAPQAQAETAEEMNHKQERFAIEYLLDGNATQAAIRAGYSAKTAYSQGQRLLKKAEVATRVRAGQAQAQARVEVTVDDMVAELNENRRLSIEKDQMAAANAASMGKAKVLGMVVDKVKDVTDLDNMDADELAAERRRLDEEIRDLRASSGLGGPSGEDATKH